MVESGVNLKVVQEVLGHKDVSTMLDIYTDVTKELAQREFENLDEKLKENMDLMRKSRATWKNTVLILIEAVNFSVSMEEKSFR